MEINYTSTHEIEKELKLSAELAVQEAQAVTIVDNTQYQQASLLLIEHKKRIKAVTEYWQKPKTMAKQAHQEICDKEKAMLAPFTQAETIIKGAMVVYQRKVDEERRAAEAEARRLQKIEADRLLAESIQAEEAGNDAQAATTLEMASAVEKAPVANTVQAPKSEGISTRRTWKARVVDASLVPAYASGIEIRTIKESALNSIAAMTKGETKIPGVEFYEDVTISARYS